MKKVLIFLLIVFISYWIYGDEEVKIERPKELKMEKYIRLNLTFPVNPVGIGYKHQIFKNVYATGNLDYYRSISDLEFRVGTEYLFPPKIVIFKFYSGCGVQFSRNNGYQYPYITVGTNFIFFYSEIVLPLKSGISPNYRIGFNFRF